MDELYEIINGKKYKRCKENQIRNPITNRCIDKDKKTAKEIKYYQAPKYLYKIIKKRERLPVNEYEKRLYIYKNIHDNLGKGSKINIVDDVIIKNPLKYGDGNIYSSYLRKYLKYKIASKIVIDNKKSENEIRYMKLLSDAVINNKCPHFPILYGVFDLSMRSEDLMILPKLLKAENYSFKMILMELAEGNLKYFMKNENEYFFANALTQIFLSLMFFHKETLCFHNNSIPDNFIYISVKKGGYFHYEIMGNNYYVENLGFLWMIYDYENSLDLMKSIDKKTMIKMDFEKIILSFLKTKNKSIINIYNVIKYYTEIYSIYNMKIYLSKLLSAMVSNGFLKTSVKSSLIINKTPYKI